MYIQERIYHFSIAKTDRPAEGFTSNKLISAVTQSFAASIKNRESSRKITFDTHTEAVADEDDVQDVDNEVDDDDDDDDNTTFDHSPISSIFRLDDVYCKIGNRLFFLTFNTLSGSRREFKEIPSSESEICSTSSKRPREVTSADASTTVLTTIDHSLEGIYKK